jgi:hypothetical protein
VLLVVPAAWRLCAVLDALPRALDRVLADGTTDDWGAVERDEQADGSLLVVVSRPWEGGDAMLVQGIRSTDAHDKKHHPPDQAHSPTYAASGLVVYVVCGFWGCPQRLAVDRAVWEAELARRQARSGGVQVWHARGDQMVPVAPDADGRVPKAEAATRPGHA